MTISLFNIAIWPAIWCKSSFIYIASWHVFGELWGVLRILFNQSTHVPWICLTLFVAYEIACAATTQQFGGTMFFVSFIITDSASLVLGTYLAFFLPRSNQTNIGLFFLYHGFISMVVGSILNVAHVLNSDKLFNFIFIFCAVFPQLWVYKKFTASSVATDEAAAIIISDVRKLTLIIISLTVASIVGSVFSYVSNQLSFSCAANELTVTITSILFPIIGLVGLFLLSLSAATAAPAAATAAPAPAAERKVSIKITRS
jgi:hypothetical protein